MRARQLNVNAHLSLSPSLSLHIYFNATSKHYFRWGGGGDCHVIYYLLTHVIHFGYVMVDSVALQISSLLFSTLF